MKQKSVGLTLRAVILALVLSLVAGTPALPPLEGVAYAQSSGLTATLAPGGSSVSLSWNAVPGADSYEIWRGEVVNNSANWGTAAYATVTGEDTTTYTDTTVTAGKTYAYGVRSVTDGTPAAWTGPYPNVAIPGGTAAPTAAPTVTVAADGNTAVDVSWTSVTGATGYYIQFWHAGLNDWERISGSQTSPYKHTGLTAGTEYYYVVAAFNAGGMGPWSSWRTDGSNVTLEATTAVPKLSLTRVDRTTVRLEWTSTGEGAEYNLERRKITTDSADTPHKHESSWGRLGLLSVTNYTDSGANYVPADPSSASVTFEPALSNGLTDPVMVMYEYRVQAIDSQGAAGVWSNVKSVNVPQPGATLGAPAGFSATTVSDSTIQVTWNAVAGAEFYELEWKSGDRGYETIRVEAVFYDHTGLSPSTKYTYKVRAVDVNGPGDYTGEKSATTRATPSDTGQMPRVTGLTVTDATTNNGSSTRKARLTWNAVSDATHYEIQRFDPTTGLWGHLNVDPAGTSTTPPADWVHEQTVTRITKEQAGSPPTIDDTFVTNSTDDPPNSPAKTYYYVVSAVNQGVDEEVGGNNNADNEMGEWSEYKSVSFKDYKPNTPIDPDSAASPPDTGLRLVKTSGSSIRISWNEAARVNPNPDADPVVAGRGSPSSYTLQWKTSQTATWNNITVGGTSYHHTGLSGNRTYNYRVRAQNSGGESGWTDSESLELGNTLAPPTGVTAVDATGSDDVPKIKVTWNAVSVASGYQVQRYGAIDGTTIGWGDLDGTLGAMTDRTPTNVTDDSRGADNTEPLSASTTYLYRVRTVKEGSTSGWSVVASGTTRSMKQDAPVLMAVTTGQSMIRLSWTPVGGATAYHLEYLEGVHSAATFADGNISRMKRTISGNHRHYVHTGLKPGTLYSYRLRAALPQGAYSRWTTDEGNTDNSRNAQTVQPYTNPVKPELSVKSTTANSITLKWAPVPFDDSDGDENKLRDPGTYQIQRRESGGKWVDVVAPVAPLTNESANVVECTSTECTLTDDGFDGDDTAADGTEVDDGLTKSTRYYYRIRATVSRSQPGPGGTYTSYWDYTNQTTPAK